MVKKYLYRLALAAMVVVVVLLSCGYLGENRNVIDIEKTIVDVKSGEICMSVVSHGVWSLEVEYEGSQKDWISLSRSRGTGAASGITICYEENQAADSRIATIKAIFRKETVSVSLTQKGTASLKRGGEGTVLPSWPDYPGLESEVLPGWIELPAVYEIEGCAWVHHDMTIDSVQPQYSGRSYSIFYDAANYMPRWVAYPLTPGLSGSGSRSNKWKQWDPKIPQEYQPATQEGGWKHEDYDRGHMISSADRVATEESNWQTFYPTNMAVQKGPKLNRRIWNNLEARVREWSSVCDTLYVVTGAVPSSEYIADRGGNAVNKPKAFYKALLQYKKGVPAEDTYVGIAFYLENRDYDEASVNLTMAMSVQDLEVKLGIDFFVNLPEEYSDYAERRFNPSYWGINN